MDLYDVMRTTAAVREYTDDPLPDDVLERILDNARFAPSGGNRQGARVVIVRDPRTREQLIELAIPGARRYIAQLRNGESPWNPLQPCGVDEETIAAVDVPPQSPLREAAVVLVVCVDLGVVAAFDQDLDRIGLIAGVVAEEPRAKELLGIPENYAIAAVLPLGKPVRQLTKLKRNSVAEIATRERFDGQPLGS